MSATVRRLLTNFSKGELSPLLEGRPDLTAYFEGGRRIENFTLMRQGGLRRRYGLRFIGEVGRVINGAVTDPATHVALLPFEASINDTFIAQAFAASGVSLLYFFKNKARIDSPAGPPVTITLPYDGSQLQDIHFTQSVDIMYLFHGLHPQRRLSRFADTNWSLDVILYTPPPSFEDDIDISSGGTLTSSVANGNGTATASVNAFQAADVGRILLFGPDPGKATGRATITGFTSATVVNITILDTVSAGAPYATGTWKIRLSPQTTLDPDKRAPVGAIVTLTAGANAFRAADVGRFIFIYGGLIEITVFTSPTSIQGKLLSEMTGTTAADPPAAAAGAWSLEVSSWTNANGFPGTGEFFSGRLAQARTFRQPTTWWLSAPDSFEDYAPGTTADRSVDFTIASRQLNRIEWLADNRDLFLGTSGSEQRAEGGREGEPIGGDVLPRMRNLTAEGSAGIQPVRIGRRVLYVDRSRKKVFTLIYDVEQDEFDSVELTGAADHIMGSGVRLGGVGVQRRADARVYFVTEDGELVVLTYSFREKVIGFTRFTTDGKFVAVAVIPSPVGANVADDQVWVIVQRTIDSVNKFYLEVFEDRHESLTSRAWASLQTDSAIVKTAVTGTVVTGFLHLKGKSVDVVVNGVFIGQKTVSATGEITLIDSVTNATIEIGLHYDSDAETFRPAIEGQIIEGLPRMWTNLSARLHNTLGGKINGQKIQYAPQGTTQALFTGDRKVYAGGWSTDGAIAVKQDEPYPMELLALFGKLQIGDEG